MRTASSPKASRTLKGPAPTSNATSFMNTVDFSAPPAPIAPASPTPPVHYHTQSLTQYSYHQPTIVSSSSINLSHQICTVCVWNVTTVLSNPNPTPTRTQQNRPDQSIEPMHTSFHLKYHLISFHIIIFMSNAKPS